MKRISLVGIGILVAGGLLGAGALVVGQTKVPPQAIASAETACDPRRILHALEVTGVPLSRAGASLFAAWWHRALARTAA